MVIIKLIQFYMNLKGLYRGESRLYQILIIIYILFIFIVTLFSANIFKNIRSFTNISNSMSPSINTGSITIVKKFNSYELGDVIAYQIKNEIITHRIMSVGGNVYTTKGDANQVADREIVLPRLIIGKVVLIIPYLGYLITFTKSQPGTGILIVFPAIIIILIELFKIYRVSKKIKKR